MKNIKISDDAHKLLKLYCVNNNLHMSECATVMITNIIMERMGIYDDNTAGLYTEA